MNFDILYLYDCYEFCRFLFKRSFSIGRMYLRLNGFGRVLFVWIGRKIEY